MATEAFRANSDCELATILQYWGVEAPDRLLRRGRQKQLERWCLNRFLTYRLRTETTLAPLCLLETENPDFILEIGNARVGLEVVEAVDADEQKTWTKQEKEIAEFRKENPNSDEIILLEVPTSGDLGAEIATMIIRSVHAKTKKCSAACSELLIYLNSSKGFFLSDHEILVGLDALDWPRDRFSKIWVLRDNGLFELTERLGFLRPTTERN